MGQDTSYNEGDIPYIASCIAELYYYDGDQWSLNNVVETSNYQVNQYEFVDALYGMTNSMYNYPVTMTSTNDKLQLFLGVQHNITVDTLESAGCAFVFEYGFVDSYEDFFGDITRLERCREIITDLFDMNYGQVYCNDIISICALDFIQGAIPTAYPSVVDTSGVISNKKIESREDLKSAIEFTDILYSKTYNIGSLFYHLNCTNVDSKFKETVSPYRPYRSMVFMITSNDDHFGEMVDEDISTGYIATIINNLRSQNILHLHGSIHVVDLVPRDSTNLVRIGLTRLAEMSGGYYTALRGGQD